MIKKNQHYFGEIGQRAHLPDANSPRGPDDIGGSHLDVVIVPIIVRMMQNQWSTLMQKYE